MPLRDDLQAALGTSYTIERELGTGGMSRVFIAEEVALERKVVVKVLAPELVAGVSAERFQREIKLAAKLQHPNIVPVITTGIAAGFPYYTMPLVGESLRDRLERSPKLPIAEVLATLKDVARALAYAHDQGIVHRDIKPENILVADESAVVTDFGIAKALSVARIGAPGGTLTQAGTSLGTPAYMAPEQISADPHVDHRADIYAFGCVAYEILTGAAPFAHRQPHQLFAAHIGEKAAPLLDRRPDCPPALAALVTRCLEKDPVDRPQSSRDLLRSLETGYTPGPSAARARRAASARKRVIGIVAAVAMVSALAAIAINGAGGADIRSLAVLPFENVGGDTANAYFAEGLADELTTELAKIPGLTLASRNSAFRFRGTSVNVEQVGRDLDVGAVLEGTVRRSGDRLHLTAQLTNASSGKLVWADSYEQKAGDLFALQETITRSIVEALKLKLSRDNDTTKVASVSQGTRNLDAYDLYLRGRFQWARRGDRELRQSINLFEQAIRLDPQFARAHAGLAMSASILPQYAVMRSDSITAVGLRAGRRAVEIDPNLADAHLGLANNLIYDFRWKEAEEHFKRALQLEPSNPTAHQWYADYLYIVGRVGDAVPEMRRAAELDPLSAVIHNELSHVLNLLGHYAEAEKAARRALELNSALVWANTNLVRSLTEQGKLEEAKKLVDADSGVSVLDKAIFEEGIALYRRLKGQSGAEQRFRKDYARLPGTAGAEFIRARMHGAARHADSTFYWLDRTIASKEGSLFFGSMPCEAAFEWLRTDPRWDAMLRRIGAVRCNRAVTQ
jgi:eukaryotic-like serine/threonine-protein kinase